MSPVPERCDGGGCPVATVSELASAVARLVSEQAALLARIVRLEAAQRPTLSDDDATALSRSLPALVGVFGSKMFTTADAWRMRVQSVDLALVLDGWTPDAFGRLLRRAVGHVIDGLLVEDLGQEGHARVWRIGGVVEVPSSESSTTRPAGPRRRACSEPEDA